MLPRRRVTGALLAVALLGTPAAGAAGERASSAAGAASGGDAAPSRASLANGCFRIAATGPFHLKPTGPSTYLLHYPDGRLLAVRGSALTRPTGAEQAGPSAEWSVRPARGGRALVRATASGRPLPSGRRCNARGLTRLGALLVRRLMDAGMLIEVDHLSEPARAAVLAIARERRRSLVSSHTGTGGTWTPNELRRMAALGGVVSATSGPAPDLIQKLARQRRFRARGAPAGVALGTDTGGFAELPGPRPREALGPLRYPFRSFDGAVLFRRQRTGTRTFDLGADGVAHYGLIADLLADVQRRPGGRDALRTLFGSAEAYLRAWERAAFRPAAR